MKKSRVGRPRQEPKAGERVQLSFRITPELKRRLDSSAEENGRSQSQEAEIRLARSFERDDMLEQVFGKAIEVAVAIMDASKGAQQSWLTGSVRTKDDIHGNQFIFVLEGEADEAVTHPSNANSLFADAIESKTTCTLNEYHYLARKNRLRLVSPSRAAQAAADAALNVIESGRKRPSRDLLAEEIRKELVAQR